MYDSHCKQQNFSTTIKPHKTPKTTSRKLKRIQRKNNTKQLHLCRDYTGKSKKRTKTLIFQALMPGSAGRTCKGSTADPGGKTRHRGL